MALASVALTCTTLSHYALNALWKEIDSIHPLLRTLPNCKRVGSQIVGQTSYSTRLDFQINVQKS